MDFVIPTPTSQLSTCARSGLTPFRRTTVFRNITFTVGPLDSFGLSDALHRITCALRQLRIFGCTRVAVAPPLSPTRLVICEMKVRSSSLPSLIVDPAQGSSLWFVLDEEKAWQPAMGIEIHGKCTVRYPVSWSLLFGGILLWLLLVGSTYGGLSKAGEDGHWVPINRHTRGGRR